ncbi:MAG: hypothetical protein DMF86_22940 [Acidobacteria bacterium]|nr:MAG: hypothetical protein DMF86_22940 [Acidobacteriota bacterium]
MPAERRRPRHRRTRGRVQLLPHRPGRPRSRERLRLVVAAPAGALRRRRRRPRGTRGRRAARGGAADAARELRGARRGRRRAAPDRAGAKLGRVGARARAPAPAGPRRGPRVAKRVIAIDRSAAVLARARGLARRRHVTNVVWRRGELEKLPLRSESVDVALLSQALHHAEDPGQALAEAARIVAPGGRVLLLDLRRHDQEWVRDRLGDRTLGFEPDELKRLLADAGLQHVKVTTGSRRKGDPFVVLIASGMKPTANRTR